MSPTIVLGQYAGYRDEEGVDPNSHTPTYFAGTLFVDNWRWEGVPFNVMTGKSFTLWMCRGCYQTQSTTS